MNDDPNHPDEGAARPPWTPPTPPSASPPPDASSDPTAPLPPATGMTPPPEAPRFTPAVAAAPAGPPIGAGVDPATSTDPEGGGTAPHGPGGPGAEADPSGSDGSGGRPVPDAWSLVAAAGGLLAALGLVALLSEPDIADERGLVLLVSAVFEVLGIALALLTRSGRAAAGGVALSLLAAIPLVNAVVTDPTDPFAAFTDASSYRNQQIGILALLAVAWLALYLVGPARRYGAYLGGALLALWSIPMTWFSLSAVDDVFSQLGGLDLFGSALGDPLDSGFGDLASTGDDLALKLGLTSLLFGGAYLAAAGWLDAQGERRRATPFFAVAPLVLISALTYLQEDLDVAGTAVLGLLLGAASIWLGVRAERRFTAWIGVAAVVGAVFSLVADAFEDSAVGAGIMLTLIGVAAVVGAGLLEHRARA